MNVVLIGRQGAGKTTFMLRLIAEQTSWAGLYVYANNREFEQLRNIHKIVIYNTTDLLDKSFTDKIYNCVFVFDDATAFLYKTHNQLMRAITELFHNYRHRNIFNFVSFHSFQHVSRHLLTLSTHIVIFKTNAFDDYFYKTLFEKHIAEVNSHENEHYYKVLRTHEVFRAF